MLEKDTQKVSCFEMCTTQDVSKFGLISAKRRTIVKTASEGKQLNCGTTMQGKRAQVFAD